LPFSYAITPLDLTNIAPGQNTPLLMLTLRHMFRWLSSYATLLITLRHIIIYAIIFIDATLLIIITPPLLRHAINTPLLFINITPLRH